MSFRRLPAILLTYCALSSAAHALTWTDRDPNSGGGPLKFLTESSPTYASDFNILLDGYNPATMYVSSATAWIAFADDDDSAEERVNFHLETLKVANLFEVDGDHPIQNYAWYSFPVTGLALTSLQDGILNYTVTLQNTSGVNDTYLKIAKLEATGGYLNVPDHGVSVGMLGCSLLGLAVMRRRAGLRR